MTMCRASSLCCVLLVFMTMPCVVQSQPQLQYSVTGLDSLPGNWAHAMDINQKGDIVGISKRQDGAFQVVVWKNGEIYALDIVNSIQIWRLKINNNGLISGWQYPQGAFVLQPDSVLPNTWILAAEWNGNAEGMNELDQVVGYFFNPRQPVLWSPTTGLIDLPNYGFEVMMPTAINNSGDIAGSYVLGGPPVSGLWYAFRVVNGVFEDLGTLYGQNTSVTSINEAGDVVGAATVAPPVSTAWVYRNEGPMIDLGALPGHTGGSTAYFINEKDQTVGTSLVDTSGVHRACLWTRNNDIAAVNELIPADSGWILESADGINNRGQIVGRGIYNGQTRAVLLEPQHGKPN